MFFQYPTNLRPVSPIEEIKPIKYKLETYGSIKLGEANITNNENNKKNKECVSDYKKN